MSERVKSDESDESVKHVLSRHSICSDTYQQLCEFYVSQRPNDPAMLKRTATLSVTLRRWYKYKIVSACVESDEIDESIETV